MTEDQRMELEIISAEIVHNEQHKALYVKYFIRCKIPTSMCCDCEKAGVYTVVKRYSEILDLHRKLNKQLRSMNSSMKKILKVFSLSHEEPLRFPGKMMFGNFKVGWVRKAWF